MAKQSGFLKRQEGRTNLFISYAERLMQQYMLDTLQIAIHREFGFGYARIMRLCGTWKAVRQEYKSAMDPRDPECDVAQEHMDRELRGIVKGLQEFYPCEERYPELNKVRYER